MSLDPILSARYPNAQSLWVPIPGGDGSHAVMFMMIDENQRVVFIGQPTVEQRDNVIGFEERHLFKPPPKRQQVGHKHADWCGGYIAWKSAPAGWAQASGHTLVSIEPLHVEASLGCRTCQSHGWIRGGEWTDAG